MMDDIAVIAPNFKRRLSGVTATIVRLVPIQARDIGIAATGPGLPDHVPHISLWRVLTLPRDRWRVWHARRNTEMLGGLILRHVFRRRLRLLFTSASQRQHSGYTKWLISKMDAVIATSGKTAQYLDRPAHVVMHGIDADGFCPAEDKSALRRALGYPQGVLVGCFGRVRRQKGVDLFVDAMLRVLPKHPDAHGLVMGRVTDAHEGFVAEQKAKVAASPVAERIHFLPEHAIDRMAEPYAALDLYVAPQRWEGFGLTPLEAMACGVPVVATRAGAFEDLIADDETGRLVDIGDLDAMTAAIDMLLTDEDRRQDWAEKARRRVLAGFRIEDEAAALVEIYRGLLTRDL